MYCPLPDWTCLTHGFTQAKLCTKILGGESNVMFVKLIYANGLSLLVVFGKHNGYIGNIYHLY